MKEKLNENQIQAILKLRELYRYNLKNCKNMDRSSELIIKAKIVAIGEVLDAIGYRGSDVDVESALDFG